jgi:hypothetical protein
LNIKHGSVEIGDVVSPGEKDDLLRIDFIDIFLSEADTLIAKDKFRLSLCSHDAYGIDTVRNPLWTVYWQVDRHEDVVSEFRRIGFKTGDTVGIDISPAGKPTVIRL